MNNLQMSLIFCIFIPQNQHTNLLPICFMTSFFDDDDERTAVRSYTKGELAMMYSPRAKYESAIRMLNRYLHRCRGLMDELMSLGYRPDDRRFTRPQVQVIFEYLGEP